MRRFLIAVPRRRARTVMGVLAVACAVSLIAPAGASAATSRTAARPGAYGYFVDTYKTNTPAATTPETNAATGVLSQFGTLWRPGSSWDSGVATSAAAQRILDSNIAQAARTTQTRTDAQGHEAYLIDRRNQSYSAIAGFGDLSDAVRTATNAGTTIPDEIPADATTKQYVDQGNAKGSWADTDSELGDVVQLVNTLRGDYSSASNAKKYYQYPRPYRQSQDVKVLPQLVPEKSPTPATDGGFPSGHTNAGYLASLAFAYAYLGEVHRAPHQRLGDRQQSDRRGDALAARRHGRTGPGDCAGSGRPERPGQHAARAAGAPAGGEGPRRSRPERGRSVRGLRSGQEGLPQTSDVRVHAHRREDDPGHGAEGC
ncbi:hypothetical protein Q9Q99_13825 [Curtobacterium flaccumfaciens]|nr:hypothetical protein Q9Q99_13825 [Curtobacterium flaccumfaciens]